MSGMWPGGGTALPLTCLSTTSTCSYGQPGEGGGEVSHSLRCVQWGEWCCGDWDWGLSTWSMSNVHADMTFDLTLSQPLPMPCHAMPCNTQYQATCNALQHVMQCNTQCNATRNTTSHATCNTTCNAPQCNATYHAAWPGSCTLPRGLPGG